MLYGIGCDLTHVPRIARVLERYGTRFLRRAFHPDEIARVMELPAQQRPVFAAGRWAAKEAVIKAAGRRLLFPDIVVLPLPLSPRPVLRFSGAGLATVRAVGVASAHVSISHDGDYAMAHVYLERGVDALSSNSLAYDTVVSRLT